MCNARARRRVMPWAKSSSVVSKESLRIQRSKIPSRATYRKDVLARQRQARSNTGGTPQLGAIDITGSRVFRNWVEIENSGEEPGPAWLRRTTIPKRTGSLRDWWNLRNFALKARGDDPVERISQSDRGVRLQLVRGQQVADGRVEQLGAVLARWQFGQRQSR